MKQNIQVMRTSTPLGHLTSQHVHVMVGYWSYIRRKVSPVVRTKAWNRWQLAYTVGGRGLLTWPDGELAMLPQTAVLLSPHTEYTYRTDPELQEWLHYSTVFLPRTHWHEWLRWPEIAPGIMKLEILNPADDDRIRRAFDKTIAIAETPRPFWEDFTLAALEKVLLIFSELDRSSADADAVDPYLKKAIDFIDQNYNKPISWPEIAKAAGVSRSYLGPIFQKHLRTTPQQYINMLRTNKAQRLLRTTNKRISEIANTVGCKSLANFCYRFRKLTGQTPGEYRKALK